MEGNELIAMKEQAMIFPEMYYSTLGYTAELLGIEEQKNEKQYYKVVVTKGEMKDTDYYDVSTGLKMRTEGKESIAEFGDYKAVDGILFPYALSQMMGPQTINFTVSSIKINAKLKDELFEIK